MLHLVLTSLPFEKGFNNLKLKKAINKVCWYVIFLFGLIGTTLLLENSSRDSCLAKNVIYEPAANDLTRDKPDCENLCHSRTSLDCSKPVLTLNELKYGLWFSWTLFIICIFGVGCGKILILILD